MLLDFSKIAQKTTDFAITRNEDYGVFNFDIEVIDSFDILLNDQKMQQVLEELISALKPAQSKVNITYVR